MNRIKSQWCRSSCVSFCTTHVLWMLKWLFFLPLTKILSFSFVLLDPQQSFSMFFVALFWDILSLLMIDSLIGDFSRSLLYLLSVFEQFFNPMCKICSPLKFYNLSNANTNCQFIIPECFFFFLSEYFRGWVIVLWLKTVISLQNLQLLFLIEKIMIHERLRHWHLDSLWITHGTIFQG